MFHRGPRGGGDRGNGGGGPGSFNSDNGNGGGGGGAGGFNHGGPPNGEGVEVKTIFLDLVILKTKVFLTSNSTIQLNLNLLTLSN